MTLLKNLRKLSGIVADSSDFRTFDRYTPLSGITTNPTLILQGMRNNAFPDLIYESIRRAKQQSKQKALEYAQDWLLVLVADKLSNYVNGRVSIEVDARLAYDQQATFERGYRIIEIADDLGIKADNLLIKIAANWDGIQAAKKLEHHGIGCNMTLIFDFNQAIACAQAQATLISPFVGRIYDWYKQHLQVDYISEQDDPGIQSVKRIYNYYKTHEINTLVMAASFRTIGQIEHLAGCDLLTISPSLLNELDSEIRQPLGSIHGYQNSDNSKITERFNKETLNKAIEANPMANEKLAHGITQFCNDQKLLEQKLATMI